jgi:hypothetical protein
LGRNGGGSAAAMAVLDQPDTGERTRVGMYSYVDFSGNLNECKGLNPAL